MVWRLGWLVTLLACQDVPRQPAPEVRFVDVTVASGIEFHHVSGAEGEYNYPETFGSGVAWLDVDGDGWLDLYFVNGGNALGESRSRQAVRSMDTANRLYHSRLGQGGAGFEDVTDTWNARGRGYGMGVAVADVDANGEVDLYLTNVGPNQLLLQQDRQFHDSELAADPRWGTGCAFTDIDRDGDLDLVAVNYVRFDESDPHACQRGSIQTYCDPEVYDAEYDILYRNLLQETGRLDLVDITQAARFDKTGRSLGLAVADLDLDGDSELYVANDGQHNFLYRNDSTRDRIHFTEVGLATGTRFNANGMAEAGMGVDVGDVDVDGTPDLIVTNFSHETHTLYLQTETTLHFRDATRRAGLARMSFKPLGFGVNLFDVDLDGDLDLFSAHGHVLDKVSQIDAELTYAQANGLYLNHRGRFEDGSSAIRPTLHDPRTSRASATADYDQDGDLDLIVTNVGNTPRLLRNETTTQHHWITVTLQSEDDSNSDGLGSRLEVRTENLSLMRQLQSGGSYLSAAPHLVHVGVGDARFVDVTVHWPGAQAQTWRDLPTDRHHRLVQGESPQ